MHKTPYYLITAVTLYRIVASLLLLYLIATHEQTLFSWLLPLSFFTDAIDGYLARKFKVASVLGAKLDSLGDDLTVLVGVIGIMVFQPQFVHQQAGLLLTMLVLVTLQFSIAFYRYGKFTSYHTYLAKLAAVLQGVFLILFFLWPGTPIALFYVAAGITILDLLEEIVLVLLLPQWRANVKGWYWIKKELS